jgi:hypothetical protein
MMQWILEPLYDLLAAIVHSDYPDPVHAVKDTIPNEINAVFDLFEALPIAPYRKDRMDDNEMEYMNLSRKDFRLFNSVGDYSDIETMQAMINKFQANAERTRIYLELRERDWDAEINFAELDF